MDRHAFNCINYGLYIISSVDEEGRYVGCIANTFEQITSNPPRASVALNKENVTTKCIEKSKKFGVSVLSEETTMELIGKFGFHSSYDIDKFSGSDIRVTDDGVPIELQNASAIFSVKVTDMVDAGTHMLFVGDVEMAEVVSDEKPMTYSYYHTVLKGKTPPKASSYNGGDSNEGAKSERAGRESEKAVVADGAAEESSGSDGNALGGRIGWRCTLCGYVVEMEELPEDFKCPICGMGKEFFECIQLD